MAFKTPEQRAAMVAKAQARALRREARKAENAALRGEAVACAGHLNPSAAKEDAILGGLPPKRAYRPYRTLVRAKAAKRKKRKVPARKRAFLDLKAACKAFVFARNKALNGGLCEIGIVCGGAEPADTWYHLWPQKGGNGLKYDVRSHAASCSRDNMGEYGARYRGTPEYVNRHRQLLGEELFNELAGLHGRRQISTAEAREMAAKIRAKTERGEWSP